MKYKDNEEDIWEEFNCAEAKIRDRAALMHQLSEWIQFVAAQSIFPFSSSSQTGVHVEDNKYMLNTACGPIAS